MTATEPNGNVIFKQEREYKNVALSPRGEPVAAAWLISTYSDEKSTAFRADEVKRETFTIPLPNTRTKEIVVHTKLISHHGLPVAFGAPAAGEVMLEASQKLVLK